MQVNNKGQTDLILNKDGSVYHLNLLPGDIAGTVITVGDPDRVTEVSKYFDTIELRKGKREFITHTGHIGNKRLTIISTGIGTDNIDIVLNELDALVNIDLKSKLPKPVLTRLDIIRIGTSGALQAAIPLDSMLVSSAAIGLDTLMHYYQADTDEQNSKLLEHFKQVFSKLAVTPYLTSAGTELLKRYGADITQGITLTAPGFYAPQGRSSRAEQKVPGLLRLINNFNFNGTTLANLEMETAGIYGLSACLGHQAISFNVIMANRATDKFSVTPEKTMDHCIRQVLQLITDKS